MRNRVIPAQITTVEDKIAGNLSLTQVLILLSPVLLTTLVYIVIPPTMDFNWYKLIATALLSIVCVSLAIRIKGKIVLQWIAILARYNLRPKYYIFNKNTTFAREIYLTEKKPAKKQPVVTAKEEASSLENLSVREMLDLQNLLNKKDFDLTYNISGKGGLNVAFEKVRT